MNESLRIAFEWLSQASQQAGLAIAAVLALRAILGPRLTPSWRAALWAVVGLRLLLPIGIETHWSVEQALNSVVTRFASARADDASLPASQVTITTLTGSDLDSLPPQQISGISSAHSLKTIDFLAAAWMLGTIALLTRHASTTLRLRRHLGKLASVDDPRINAILKSAVQRAGVSRPIRLAWSDALRSPAVCGGRLPTILLPVDAASMSDADLRLALLHECIHVRRHDALIASIAAVVRALHWPNPLVWLAVSAARNDRELACDAAVLAAIDAGERTGYGACLLRVAERVTHLRSHPMLLGAFGSRRHLTRRIEMIARFPTTRRWPGRLCGMLALVAVGFGALTCAPRRSSEAGQTASTRPTTPGAADVSTHTYDIRDLLVVIPDFSSQSSSVAKTEQHDTTPAADNLPASRDQLLSHLISMIQHSVDPRSWTAPDSAASIQELGGQLVVTQTQENHAAIVALLTQLRERRSIQLLVVARFITIDADRVPQSVSAMLSGKIDAQPQSVLVSKNQVDAILHDLQTAPKVDVLTAPRLTLFNGQRAYVKVSTQHAYISDFTMTQNAAGERKFEPTTDNAETGVTFDVQATLTADHKSITLTVQPKVTTLLRIDSTPFAGDPDHSLLVQKPVLETLTSTTTCDIPTDGSCILQSTPTGADRKQVLLLLVSPTVIDQRESKG